MQIHNPVLLQRGIRINPTDKKLWLEYFKLEILWVEKIKERRKILLNEELKQNDAVEPEGEDQVDVPKLEIEKNSEDKGNVFELGEMASKDELSPTQAALLEYVIPRAVYKNAIKGIYTISNVSDSYRLGLSNGLFGYLLSSWRKYSNGYR